MLMRPSRSRMMSARRPEPPAARTLTLPAPIGGLNARDALASMPNTDAVKLDNFFPSPTSVDLRNGYARWSTGYPAAVESLMTYNGPTVSKLFAASSTSFYDATTQGAVGAAVVTGLANSRWQHVNMGTPGGQFLVAVNGVDYPRTFNGTNWITYAAVAAQSVTTITNVGTLATVTTAQAHALQNGNYVTVLGAAPAAYNGNYAITVVPAIASVPISSITRVGTLATLTTTVPHTLPPGPGNLLTISGALPAQYNGTYQVTILTVIPVTISTITHVGAVATLTTTGVHSIPLGGGSYITVTGATPAQYNGTYAVNVTSTTQLTYTMASDPGANASVVGAYVVEPTRLTYTMGSDPGASAAPVGSYVVELNKFTYVMATDPGGSASPVGSYLITPSVTGVDPRNFIHVNLYASRVFFVEKDSARVWYLPVNSIGGAAQQLDFSSLLNLGGYIMAMATWTIDNAAGVNEYAVFISSEGEVLMYSGTDPAVAANWVKAGRFRIGRPVGRRCFMRVSSDVILLTADGFMPMSQAMLTDRAQQVALSDKITNLVSADLTNYANNFGWEATFHPAGDKLVFNVPSIANSMQYQYVMNTINGSWCRFTGWNANVFQTMADTLYFGSNLGTSPNSAFVAKADFGYSDDGGYVAGEVKTAFQFFGVRGREKQITMVRPIFQSGGNIQAALGMDMDFSDKYPATMPTFSGNGGTLWNTAFWNTFPWASSGNIRKDWQGVTGVGDAGALHMRVVNNRTALQWQSIQYVFKIGRIL